MTVPPIGNTPDGAEGPASPVRIGVSGVARTRPRELVVFDSRELFGGAVEVHIDHHGAVYRLKQTSLGKLILTK